VKRLWLLRHAKASPAEAALSDFDRLLTERGERDARSLAERLARAPRVPTRIVASPAARTRRTAEIAAEALGHPAAGVLLDDGLYLGSTAAILAAIARHDDVDSLLIVGHNPGLSELVLELAPEFPLDDLPTSGLVGIDTDTPTWLTLSNARCRLRCYDFPKNLAPPINLD
jgi:phosphohistidine phosphatase